MLTKFDKSILNGDQGASELIPKYIYRDKHITVDNMLQINQKFMGGGMSQNYFSIPFFEYYHDSNFFEYVVEIGTQKGALSTYFANFASITQSFLFETYEIYPDKDLNNRSFEGCGHWLTKLAELSPYFEMYHEDVFSEPVVSHIKENIEDMKTFIFCDGGNKTQEFNTYAPILKSGDCIAVHDWGNEIRWEDIRGTAESHGLVPDEPFSSSSVSLKTQIMPFRKS